MKQVQIIWSWKTNDAADALSHVSWALTANNEQRPTTMPQFVSTLLNRRCCSLSWSVPLLQVSYSLPPTPQVSLLSFVISDWTLLLPSCCRSEDKAADVFKSAKADSSKDNKQQAGSGKCVGVDLMPSVVTSYIFYFKPTIFDIFTQPCGPLSTESCWGFDLSLQYFERESAKKK